MKPFYRLLAAFVVSIALVAPLVACGGGSDDDETEKAELPYVFGPIGQWTGECAVPDPNALITGCVTSYTIGPQRVDVVVEVTGVPSGGVVTVLACNGLTECPATATAQRRTIGGAAGRGLYVAVYEARVPLPAPEGITEICATVTVLAPQPPLPALPVSLEFVRLGCAALPTALRPAAGAFRITQQRNGIMLDGWMIDMSTDLPGQFAFSRGTNPNAAKVEVTARDSDARSVPVWSGFSDEHGFTALLPYAGTPGTHDVCLRLLRPAAPGEPVTGLPIACFDYDERSELFISESSVQQGATVTASIRSVSPGKQVAVNFRSEGGYFVLPWTHSDIWSTTSDADGNADIAIASTHFPPGNYTVAFHCTPDCPGGSLTADDLVGGPRWTGYITLGSRLTVLSVDDHVVTVECPSSDVLRIQGSGFQAREAVRVVVVPNIPNADGPLHEAFFVVHVDADQQGTFTADADILHFPVAQNVTQVVAFDINDRPVASTLYREP